MATLHVALVSIIFSLAHIVQSMGIVEEERC